MTNILSDLRRLTEAVHAAGADIAPTYREYVQLAFAIATDCGEAGRSDFLMLCSLSAKYDVHAANKLFSNALKTNNNSVHIGTAFHLAELCNVRPRPAEKPRLFMLAPSTVTAPSSMMSCWARVVPWAVISFSGAGQSVRLSKQGSGVRGSLPRQVSSSAASGSAASG